MGRIKSIFRSSILPLQLDRSFARCHSITQNKCVAGESCSMCLRPLETVAEADIQANALAIHWRMDKDKAISTCEDCLCSSLSNSSQVTQKASVCPCPPPAKL